MRDGETQKGASERDRKDRDVSMVIPVGKSVPSRLR